MPRLPSPRLLVLGLAGLVSACTGASEEAASDGNAYTSNDANVLELAFEGNVVAASGANARQAIATQLTYLQGALTSDVRGNAQAGMPTLANIRETADGDIVRITYDAKVAVAWPKRLAPPTTYEVVLPADVTSLATFNATYDGRCGRNEYGQDTFWHDWNPKASGCTIEDRDVMRASATLKPHPLSTENKYPEYDKVWEDGALDVVAVFGIISANTPSDEGARMREKLLARVASSLSSAERTEAPAAPGVIADSTVSGRIAIDGQERRVNVTGILVQETATAGPAFEARFAAASEKADLVVYEGHSGLGTNINALGRSMGAAAGKYQLVYLYGCQTLGYLGPEMHAKRVALNGEETDPDGTKYLDVIATALPAYGDGGRSTTALYDAMLAPSRPKSFNELIDGISPFHLVVVFGEHDNTFQP